MVQRGDILGEGNHLGYQWQVLHNGMGNRCGYVRIPRKHPWFAQDYNGLEVEVHGGLTFGAMDPDGQSFWIGFDAAHYYDLPDPELLEDNPLAPFLIRMRSVLTRTVEPEVRTQSYMEDQCRRLCEQVAAAAGTPTDDQSDHYRHGL